MAVTFAVANDNVLEGMESFTGSVSSNDQQVLVTVPSTEVVILDEDGVLCFSIYAVEHYMLNMWI